MWSHHRFGEFALATAPLEYRTFLPQRAVVSIVVESSAVLIFSSFTSVRRCRNGFVIPSKHLERQARRQICQRYPGKCKPALVTGLAQDITRDV